MHQIDYDWRGFEWLVSDDYLQNILVYERRDADGNRMVAVINFSPVPHEGYRFGAHEGEYTELIRTEIYKWSQSGDKYKTEKIPSHGKDDSIAIDVPPMGGILLYCPCGKKQEKKPTEKPAAVKPVAPVETKPAEAKPAAAKTTTAKPAAKRPAASTAAKETSAKTATTKTTTAKKPAAKKSK